MTKIIHLSDTHLGFRLRYDLRRDWYKFGEIRWYENDFYRRWNELIDYCIENKDGIDFIVHAGDLFHLPFEGNPYPTPEPARETVVRGLKRFFQETDNSIPFILIDGNHGVYHGYRYSILDSISPNFPKLYFFSIWDLKKAVADERPLICEFLDKNTRFYLFPYFKFTQTSEIKIKYNNWIEKQRPKEDMVEIAVVHGSPIDSTFHEKVTQFHYDYVALGHEHNQSKITNHIYFSGSFVPLHFNEIDFLHGFLEVDIQKGKKSNVNVHNFKTPRDFKLIELEITPTSTSKTIINLLNKVIAPYKTDNWNGKTAARLKINFKGKIELKSFWGLNDELNTLKTKILNEGKYNVLQIILNWKLLSKELGDDLKPEIIEEYILESPKDEFLEFLKTKIKSEDGYDMDMLADLAIQTIENALKKDEGAID